MGIGLFAFAFPLLSGITDWVIVALVDVESPRALGLGVRAILAFGLLLVPTTLMGATLP